MFYNLDNVYWFFLLIFKHDASTVILIASYKDKLMDSPSYYLVHKHNVSSNLNQFILNCLKRFFKNYTFLLNVRI